MGRFRNGKRPYKQLHKRTCIYSIADMLHNVEIQA